METENLVDISNIGNLKIQLYIKKVKITWFEKQGGFRLFLQEKYKLYAKICIKWVSYIEKVGVICCIFSSLCFILSLLHISIGPLGHGENILQYIMWGCKNKFW